MRRLWTVSAVGLAGAIALVATTRVPAMMIAIAPLPQRLVTAECVVVGKVSAIEEKTIEAARAPGADKVLYKVAVIKIGEEIKGANGLTSIRIGFIPPEPPAPPPVVPNNRPALIRPIRRQPQVNFVVGQEVLVFLTKHHEKDFYVAPMYFDVVAKQGNATFDKDVVELKKCVKLLKNPEEGLKSKDAEDRFLTAALLLAKYRIPQGRGNQRQEMIPADESKQILLAIADADWSKPGVRSQLSPQAAFGQLSPMPQDGWKPGPFKNYQVEFPEAAKKWLKDNAATYRVKKFVADEPAKK